jgi:hypothetical protein
MASTGGPGSEAADRNHWLLIRARESTHLRGQAQPTLRSRLSGCGDPECTWRSIEGGGEGFEFQTGSPREQTGL